MRNNSMVSTDVETPGAKYQALSRPRLLRTRYPALATLLAMALLVASSGLWGASVTNAASGTTQPQSPASPQHFQDVPSSSPFYAYVQSIADAGIVAGYPCGTPPAGACVPPGNLPYYLPGSNVSRGQMAKFEDNGRNLPGINMNGGTMLSPWIIFSQATGGHNITSISNANNQSSFEAIANGSNSTLIEATNLAGSNETGVEAHIYGTSGVGMQSIMPSNSSIGFNTVVSGTFSSGLLALSTGNSSDGVAAAAHGDTSHALVASTSGSNSDAVEAISSGSTSYGLYAGSGSYRAGYFQSTDPNTNWASLYVDPGHGGKAAQFNGDVTITGTLTVGSCVGCFGPSGIMQNVGDTPIEAGDVVQIVSTSSAVVGTAPVMQIRKSDAAYQGTVIGVAGQALYVPSAETRAAYDRQNAAIRDAQNRIDAIKSGAGTDAEKAAAIARISMPQATIDDSMGTVHVDSTTPNVATNAYGTLATDGAVPAIKVTAANGSIHAGDLLVSSGTPGVAMKADPSKANTGVVIGKALSSLESGTGTVPVLITLK